MNKNLLREKYKKKRAELSADLSDELSLSIANQLLKLPIWEYSYYHLFLPIVSQREIDTEYLLSILQGKDKNVVLPKVVNGAMENYLLTDATKIVLSQWGIPEPVEGIEVPEKKIEVVFVPLLAFDLNGHRIGYGKGMYDEFLAKCNTDVIKIGLSFFDPEEEISELFETDIKLDYCVTPKQVFHF